MYPAAKEGRTPGSPRFEQADPTRLPHHLRFRHIRQGELMYSSPFGCLFFSFEANLCRKMRLSYFVADPDPDSNYRFNKGPSGGRKCSYTSVERCQVAPTASKVTDSGGLYFTCYGYSWPGVSRRSVRSDTSYLEHIHKPIFSVDRLTIQVASSQPQYSDQPTGHRDSRGQAPSHAVRSHVAGEALSSPHLPGPPCCLATLASRRQPAPASLVRRMPVY